MQKNYEERNGTVPAVTGGRIYLGETKMKRRKKKDACCEMCSNLIAIGKGDHFCFGFVTDDGAPVIMPISDYSPTKDYFKCGGSRYEGK